MEKKTTSLDIITQAELAYFALLKDQMKQHEQFRLGILDRHKRGVKVEKGEWRLSIKPFPLKAWSRRAVAEVIGEDEAAGLWDDLPQQIANRLYVTRKPKRG